MRAEAYRLTLLVGDIVIFFLALGTALAVRRPEYFSGNYYLYHASFFSVLLPVIIGVNSVLSLYDFRQIRELDDIIRESLLAFVYAFFVSLAIFYAAGGRLPTPKTHLALTLFFTMILGIAWRRFWMGMSASAVFATKTLFLGDNPTVRTLLADLQGQKYSRFRLVQRASFDNWLAKRLASGSDGAQRDPGASKIVDLIVVDAEPAQLDPENQGIISAAIDEGIPIWTHVDFYEEFYKKVPLFAARNPAWLFANVLHRRNEFYVAFKRMLDVCCAVTILLVLSPAWPLIALAIKLNDGGPVFFSQERAGYLKETFLMWKFRTMRVGAEKHGYIWTSGKPDPRITSVGRFLRKFRIDEFPQFWNVIKGEMSLVGPRPTWDGETQVKDISEYHIRRLVKPGITGWAQINSAATDSLADTREKVAYDLYYVKNMSLALDISILLKTARRVLQSDAAFRKKMSSRHAAAATSRNLGIPVGAGAFTPREE